MIHVYSGYSMIFLIFMRLIWGFHGSHYARFRQFVTGPKVFLRYARSIIKRRPPRYLGHNPAGGAMVMALLLSLTATLLFGLLSYATLEYSGPLAALADNVSHQLAHRFNAMHEWFANFTLLLIGLHLSGVLLASLQHRENLVKSMFTGYKPVLKGNPDQVP